MAISRLYNSLKNELFPTVANKEVKKWYADGGDQRLRFNYELNSNSIVFDLGGFEGNFASDLYSRMPCKIYVFEPVKSFAAGLSNRFRLNPDIRVFNYGLSSADQEAVISVEGPGSSIHRKSHGITERVALRKISDVLSELNIDRIDLLKINIEGGEYEVLQTLIEENHLPKIANLQIQFHEIDAASLAKKERIGKSLKLTHDCIYRYEFVWEDWRIKTSPYY